MNFVRLILLIILFTPACRPDQTLEDQLMGKWHVHRVTKDGEDVSATQIPEQDRWICFFHDGNFAGEGGQTGRQTGAYSIDETTAVLMLDSDHGTTDDSDWIVRFSNDTLIMQALDAGSRNYTHLYAIRAQ